MKTHLLIMAISVCSLIANATDPVVSNVQIYGDALYNASATAVGSYSTGTLLTGYYDFTDADGDTDASTYNWYIDTDNDGLWTDEVSVATGIRYTVPNPSTTPAIFFVVSPEDSNAETASDEASASKVPATTTYDNSGTSSVVVDGTSQHELNVVLANNKDIDLSNGAVLTIHGDLDSNNGDEIIVRDGTTLIVKGQFITNNNIIVTVEEGGTFNVESGFQANNNAVLTISGVVNITGDLGVNNNTTFTVEGTGTVAVSGDVNFGPGSNDLIVNGTMTVGGDITGSADLSGTGLLDVTGDIGSGITDTTGGVLLPIELIYFDLQKSKNCIIINWQTATELNNDFFTIQRSRDGIEFENIAIVKGAGNSSSTINYTFTDSNPLNGVSYYRLKQTDYDGNFEMFSIASISYLNENSVFIGPTFTSNQLNISVVNEVSNVIVSIYTLSGLQLKTVEIQNNNSSIDISDLPSSTYLVILSADDNYISKIIVVQ